MRTLFLAAIAMLLASSSFAQASQQKNDAVFALVKQYFNEKNATALYELTGAKFREKFTSEAFGEVSKKLFSLGAIQQSELLSYNDGISTYKLTCAVATVSMILALDDKNKLRAFAFQPYTPPVPGKPALVATSNSLTSVQDRQVDTAARKYIQKANTVGLSIGVYKDGKTTVYNYGETGKGNKKLPAEESIFEIGSVSKTFTATLLAYYVQQKKVQLNDPITIYLPDSVKENKDLQAITLLMLSNHTSGLPRMPANFDAHVKDQLNPYDHYTTVHLFSELKKVKPAEAPGSHYDYSNLAVGLLGVILERVSGKTYEQMVKEVICAPLQMSTTVQKLNNDQKARFVTVYNEKGDPTPAWDFEAFAGAGALRSSVADMLSYARANLLPGTTPLGKAIALTHQVTNTKTIVVGLGWHGATIKGVNILWHNGGTYGSSSYVAFVPGRDVAVVVLSNASESVDDVARAILAALL